MVLRYFSALQSKSANRGFTFARRKNLLKGGHGCISMSSVSCDFPINFEWVLLFIHDTACDRLINYKTRPLNIIIIRYTNYKFVFTANLKIQLALDISVTLFCNHKSFSKHEFFNKMNWNRKNICTLAYYRLTRHPNFFELSFFFSCPVVPITFDKYRNVLVF